MACLVNYLDFSPINRELSTALAQRFVRTLDLANHERMACLDLQDRFFSWLTPKVQPQEHRVRTRRRQGSAFTSDLRLIGLIDQYRASGTRPDGACPLFRAAFSEEA